MVPEPKAVRVPASEELEALTGADKALEQKYQRLLEKRRDIDRRLLEVLNELEASRIAGRVIRDLIDAEKKRTPAGV